MALAGWSGGDTLDSHAELRFFQYWKENSVFLDAIRDNDLQNLLLERTTLLVDRMKENREPGSFAREQVEYFVAHGLMATVLRWHQLGFPASPEEMAAIFGKLLTSTDVSITRLIL